VNEIRFDVSAQGAIIVNTAVVTASSDNLIAIVIDLTSKYVVIESTGVGDSGPMICLGADENTLNTSRRHQRDELTMIEFPFHKGWEVFASAASRCSVNVCLIKTK
jgi:hypothetical protein